MNIKRVIIDNPTNWISHQMHNTVAGVKKGLEYTASMCEMSEGPEYLADAVAGIASVLMYIPPLEAAAQPLKNYTKDLKTFFNLLKGIKSVNTLVNKSFVSWKIIALNVSGAALLTLSLCSYIEKFKWSNLSTLHKVLDRIPIVNVLPFSGLLNLSLISLHVSLLLIHLEKEGKLKSNKIKPETKALFWKDPLTHEKAEKRVEHYKTNVANVTKNLEQSKNPNLELKLFNASKKQADWEEISHKLEVNSDPQIEQFRQAKLNKWKSKIQVISNERKTNAFSIAQRILTITSTLFVSAATITGTGLLVALPAATAFSLVGTSLGLTSFVINTSTNQIKRNLKPISYQNFASRA